MSTDNIDELDLYRALQTLKDKDGNYVLSTISFSSQYGLQRLIEFIEDRESKLKAHYARREAEILERLIKHAEGGGVCTVRYYDGSVGRESIVTVNRLKHELAQLTPQTEQERKEDE